MRRFALVAVLLLALARASDSQAATPTPYPRTISLWGDSISRGYGLGVFADQVALDHPMYAFRSITSIMRLVFADNGIGDGVEYSGELFLGDVPQTAAIEHAWQTGAIRVGDVVVFEDAGPAPLPDEYEAQWWMLREAATEYHPVTLLMLDTFDVPPAPLDSQYSTPIDASGRTRNDATDAVALTPMPYIGQTLLLPMHAVMAQEHGSAVTLDGVPLMHADGIHPNVWGQMLMAGEILKLSGYSPSIHSLATAREIAAANWQALSYGAPNFSAQRAEDYVEWLLRR